MPWLLGFRVCWLFPESDVNLEDSTQGMRSESTIQARGPDERLLWVNERQGQNLLEMTYATVPVGPLTVAAEADRFENAKKRLCRRTSGSEIPTAALLGRTGFRR